jgi:chemotaxis protein histidine kinase CheA
MGLFRYAITALALQGAVGLMCTAARAEDATFLQALDSAKAKLASKDYRGAERTLDDAKDAAPQSGQLILSEDLSRMLFYRGVAEWYGGDRDKAALDAWRATAVLNPAYQPDAAVLPETEAQDAFYAIVSEVKGYTEAQLNIPEDTGDSMLFIDGTRKEVGDTVRVGEHFVQLRCGEGNVVGAWYTFGVAPPDYTVLCSGGAYPGAKVRPVKKADKADKADKPEKTAAEVTTDASPAKAADEKPAKEKPAPEKVAKEKAPEQAPPEKAAAEKAQPEKATPEKAEEVAKEKPTAEKPAKPPAEKTPIEKTAAEKAPVEKTAAEKAPVEKDPVEKTPVEKAPVEKAPVEKAPVEKTAKAAPEKADKAVPDKAVPDKPASDKPVAKSGGVAGYALMGAGAALLGSGAAVNFLVVNSAWNDGQRAIEAPSTVSPAEAQAIESRFNAGRWATIALLAGGAVSVGTGVVLGPLHTSWTLSPTGVGVHGTW